MANGLTWGPDGWLYGRCGASSVGAVRRPDQPDGDAVPLYGGIWRYHPDRRTFEVLCHGTTNPWGLDFTAEGEGIFVNTVNAHLWHLIPGAHFDRSHTITPNRFVYEPIGGHADHWHFDTGKGWTDSRDGGGTHDAAGGGHAHCGCLIYRGNNWPSEYQNRLLTLNFHGKRVNVERIEPLGSGIVARHEPDMLFAADPYFRGLNLIAAPDGTVMILDWSDTGECHDSDGVHRSSGRIFRVRYDDPDMAASPTPSPSAPRKSENVAKPPLSQRSLSDLFALLFTGRNDAGYTINFRHDARREIIRRAAEEPHSRDEWNDQKWRDQLQGFADLFDQSMPSASKPRDCSKCCGPGMV